MATETLGDRMKDFYESRSKMCLTRRTPVIIRIDGCCFHTFTKGLKKPFDDVFFNVMKNTCEDLCKAIQGCKLGYVQSDEISLLLTDYDTLQSDCWYNYSVQKLCSVTASMAAMFFNKNWRSYVDYMKGMYSDLEDLKYHKKLLEKTELGGYFDAKAFNLPEREVVNYFIWRQNDATKNSIQALAQANFSQKQLQNLSNSQLQEKLFNEKRINWNDCSTAEKHGICVKKTGEGWTVDTEIPIFSQDREYIEEVLPTMEISLKVEE